MLLQAACRHVGMRRSTAIRGVATSAVRLGGTPPVLHVPPPPPPEFEPDGSPKKYPLMQPLWDHGYDWEHWSLKPAGAFHTIYYGDFAQDYAPYWAWLQQYPVWSVAPVLVLWALVTMVVFQNAGSIGIKPKRYTIEWMQASKERERQENCNPVTRYLDRRREERGGVWIAQYHLPWHPYFMWMSNSHDPEFVDEYGMASPPRPGLHYTDKMTVPFKNE
eukprot:TRINITY_DN375_c0_g1_i4.p2 TRINITY_DN375_c0_g1~~TRINITY_DN375_c0_g1_i4.p2  ORF type:complete len:219 (-),score=36.66 TRINITY_DN375_c0_g1_i4:139-795(-)